MDQTELLAWLGTKADTRENAGEVKKEMERVKGQLIDALAARGEALLKRRFLQKNLEYNRIVSNI